MSLIKGTTITLIERKQSGVDAFNQPIYVETQSIVDNVLIIVSAAPENVQQSQMYGRKRTVNIGIPKGDAHNWLNSSIIWNGTEYRQVGQILSGIVENIPGDWDRSTTGEAYG